MQIFVIGPPRSGTTIVAQVLNSHPRIKIFDEVDFIEAAEFGGNVVGKLRAFLQERALYDRYRSAAETLGDGGAALHRAMTEAAAPDLIWGEKNPMYATRFEALRRAFPDALILYVLRDPRAVVNSCLRHRAARARTGADFWIKNTVSEALALVERCLEPLRAGAGLAVVRYERFIEDPKAALGAELERRGVTLPDPDRDAPYAPPETLGQHQFLRGGALLPWKCGNLAPLRPKAAALERLDPADPAWRRVEALADRFGYA